MGNDYMGELETLSNQFEESDSSSNETVESGSSSDANEKLNDDKDTVENRIRDYEKSLNKPDEEKKEDTEEKPEAKSVEQLDLIAELNKLGITRKGLPVEFDTLDKVKENLSKGFDYTEKTQELANEKKSWSEEAEKQKLEIETIRQEAESFREQNQEKIVENEVMGQILSDLKNSDPDLFDVIANNYRQKMDLINFQKNNPAIQGINKELSQIKTSLLAEQKQKEQQVFNQINQDWEKGLADTQQEFAKTLKASGIKPNWQSVQENWKSDASGKTSVTSAFLAVHGKDLLKAIDANKKTTELKLKSAQRIGPAKISSDSNQKQSEHGKNSYMKYIEELASKY